ncbi:hypothetical protein NA57DRAFT_65681 [Rhizodiscina lignyota]|uniref:Cellular morphogenesis protein n=1 Tax=Rhizodiscina lignyota TaxID=1504668 RepID=A0A9P4M9V6_9PEZI|nr:hypothetical protein NA57DRAFT_65681 [Rhizodiscina lignyota]
MRSSLLGRSAGELAALLLAASSCLVPGSAAITFTPTPSANLDLSQLGRVALAGDFDSISLFEFVGQNENSFNTNGSQSLLQQYPNGAFATLSTADGYIHGLCPYVLQNGTLAGVVVGGNFTSLGGVEAQGIALWNPDSGAITPLPGLSGQVASVYCDANSSTVYVGGSFTGANSSNAIAWTTEWTNLPFAGFNGPVTSITKAPNGNIVFGGQFDGLGNATSPKQRDMQVIPVTSANISASPSSGQPGFTDPKNIICKTGDQDGSGNTWLLADNVPGFWQAAFQFGFVPTKLRLYNTKEQGRGTKTWRFTALPINGIMRFTYIDPQGQNKTCDAQCPLPQNNETFQDFHFVNAVGMNEFRIDISAWYGQGGGLAGIELFEDDIYSYAINNFNEPKCDGVSPGTASATVTGPWDVTPSGKSTSEYLSTTLLGSNIRSDSASVVFTPNIRQSGNYSVQIYTPGCIQDNTCTNRGRVNITGQMGSPTGTMTKGAAQPYSTQISQTNNFDKYDQIYLGYIDMTSDTFKPTVTLTPSSGQVGPLTIVAQRVRFELITSSGGLNGLFEFNPNQATIDTDFSKSAIDTAGTGLSGNAMVNALATNGQSLYVGGNFSTSDFDNIFSVGTGDPASLPGGGLNAEVNFLYQNGSLVYVGGSFNNTRDGTVGGLNGVAVYDTSAKTWRALGSGVNGSVTNIVPLQVNNEPTIAISGFFDQVLRMGNAPSFAADGIALWDPARENWVNNLNISSIAIEGALSAMTEVPGFQPLYAGSVSSSASAAHDAVELTQNNGLSLQQLPINVQDTQADDSTITKRDLTLVKRAAGNSTNTGSGAATGLMYDQNGFNITAIGGHFTATAGNGSQINNLLIINGSTQSVTGISSGIDQNSTFLALGAAGSILYAGGTITGNVNGDNVTGLVLYDLGAEDFSTTQPPELQGASVSVNAIAPQPNSQDVYVGGSFTSGGSFNCPSLCIWDSARAQWNNPGSGIGGEVQTMAWVDNNQLLIGGNLTVNGTSHPLTIYDAKNDDFTAVPETDSLPGSVTALCSAASDGKSYWVAGTAKNGSSYIEKFDGSKWTPVPQLGEGSVVKGIQIFMLTQDHGDSAYFDNNQALLVLGQLVVPNFGNASAALFDGSKFTPFLLSNVAGGGPGTIAQVIVQNPGNFFKSGGGHLAVGFVVLIGLAISLVLIFLLVVAGIVAERVRRRREGYTRAPTQPFFDRGNMSRVPPAELLQSLGRGDRL